MIKGLFADVIITVYLLVTLLFRIFAEPALENHPFISIAAGAVLLLFIWALIKTNILVPSYFGLLKNKPK